MRGCSHKTIFIIQNIKFLRRKSNFDRNIFELLFELITKRDSESLGYNFFFFFELCYHPTNLPPVEIFTFVAVRYTIVGMQKSVFFFISHIFNLENFSLKTWKLKQKKMLLSINFVENYKCHDAFNLFMNERKFHTYTLVIDFSFFLPLAWKVLF